MRLCNQMTKTEAQTTEDKVIHTLLRGTHPEYSKYQGKHVMVIEGEIVPVEEGEQSTKDYKGLEEKYGRSPVLTFIPRKDSPYILWQ